MDGSMSKRKISLISGIEKDSVKVQLKTPEEIKERI
jgi:hypothetical protein